MVSKSSPILGELFDNLTVLEQQQVAAAKEAARDPVGGGGAGNERGFIDTAVVQLKATLGEKALAPRIVWTRARSRVNGSQGICLVTVPEKQHFDMKHSERLAECPHT